MQFLQENPIIPLFLLVLDSMTAVMKLGIRTEIKLRPTPVPDKGTKRSKYKTSSKPPKPISLGICFRFVHTRER